MFTLSFQITTYVLLILENWIYTYSFKWRHVYNYFVYLSIHLTLSIDMSFYVLQSHIVYLPVVLSNYLCLSFFRLCHSLSFSFFSSLVLSLFLSPSLSLCLSLSLSLSVFLSISLGVCLSPYASRYVCIIYNLIYVYKFIHVSIDPSISFSIWLHILVSQWQCTPINWSCVIIDRR